MHPLDQVAQTMVGWLVWDFAVRDTAEITIDYYYEIMYGLSISAKVNDLE